MTGRNYKAVVAALFVSATAVNAQTNHWTFTTRAGETFASERTKSTAQIDDRAVPSAAPAESVPTAASNPDATSNIGQTPLPTVPSAPEDPVQRARRALQVRDECIQGRRIICGRVLKITKTGLVIESGYTSLLRPPFNKSWLVSSTISAAPEAHTVERNTPGSPCIGVVFLTDIPRRPAVKLYDFVLLQGYPAGNYDYTPAPTIHKSLRKFAALLENAVTLNLAPVAQ